MEREKKDYKKEFNLSAKIIYREWLLDTIENNDFDAFKECVLNLGTEWHVIRTVKKNSQIKFIEHLWNNISDIKSGKYKGWEKSNFKAYSFESKVCFLINPQHYKIIYDTNNMKALKRRTNKCINHKNWQEAADKYYEDNYKGVTDIQEIFEIDFELWNSSDA